MRALPRVLVLLLAPLLASCAAPAGSPGPGRSSDLITAEEIQANPSPNTYELIRKLHPSWLRGRGSSTLEEPSAGNAIVVYLDATRFGSVDALRQLPTTGIRSIRYLTPSSPGVRVQGNEHAYVIQVRLEG